MASAKSINIRVSQEEHQRFTTVSKKLNISVSKLVKTVLNEVYKELSERGMLAVVDR